MINQHTIHQLCMRHHLVHRLSIHPMPYRQRSNTRGCKHTQVRISPKGSTEVMLLLLLLVGVVCGVGGGGGQAGCVVVDDFYKDV